MGTFTTTLVTCHRYFLCYVIVACMQIPFLLLLKVSDAVEERMASKAKAKEARKADSFLRKGRLAPEQEEEVR